MIRTDSQCWRIRRSSRLCSERGGAVSRHRGEGGTSATRQCGAVISRLDGGRDRGRRQVQAARLGGWTIKNPAGSRHELATGMGGHCALRGIAGSSFGCLVFLDHALMEREGSGPMSLTRSVRGSCSLQYIH
ncbi:hypothetical protein B0T13DRAFT_158306 [Neurospora crassa]|nr:hypothetical protein B0T13DRAFT_158306 [Neurospora crassa]